jgi:hypothetical protein
MKTTLLLTIMLFAFIANAQSVLTIQGVLIGDTAQYHLNIPLENNIVITIQRNPGATFHKLITSSAGTVTSVTIGSAVANKPALPTNTYGILSEGRYFNITGLAAGRYPVSYGACHRAGDFYIDIK